MNKLTILLGTALFAAGISASAMAKSPDIYVVNFRADNNAESALLDAQLPTALAISGANAEEVVIDTSNPAKWEKGAHEAFDRDIVPVFNKWVGLPGFAAVVDAKSKRVLGCVDGSLDANSMADELRKLAKRSSGAAFVTRASSRSKTTKCPPAFNVDNGG